MMPINLQLRKMIIKNIPAITEEEIRRYEALVLLRFQIFVQLNLDHDYLKISSPKGRTYKVLNEQSQTKDITQPFKDNSEKLKQLKNIWIARRRQALTQGKYFMPPYPRKNLILWLKALAAFQGIQLRRLFQPIYIFYVNNFKRTKTKSAKVN